MPLPQSQGLLSKKVQIFLFILAMIIIGYLLSPQSDIPETRSTKPSSDRTLLEENKFLRAELSSLNSEVKRCHQKTTGPQPQIPTNTDDGASLVIDHKAEKNSKWKTEINWIVTYSRSGTPTPEIKKWSQVMPWRTVVIGTRDNTKEKWAQFKDLTYLGPKDQKELGFAIEKILPKHHYSRKMLGYLYAIEHGASKILELDETATFENNTFYFYPEDDTQNIEGLSSTSIAVNPYEEYTNQPFWPRGVPLTHRFPPNHNLRRRNNLWTKSIQHTLRTTPSVDSLQPGPIPHFHQNSPLGVSPCAFAPFDTSSTLFYPSAFHTMFIPPFLNEKVSDIWRAYIAQRIIREHSGALIFIPPTISTIESPPNLTDEEPLFFDTYQLIRTLLHLELEPTNIPDMLMTISNHMTAKHFWGKDDNMAMKIWIEDLINVHHKFPTPTTRKLKERQGRYGCSPDHNAATISDHGVNIQDLESIDLSEQCSYLYLLVVYI